jgi:hypothetical protein
MQVSFGVAPAAFAFSGIHIYRRQKKSIIGGCT